MNNASNLYHTLQNLAHTHGRSLSDETYARISFDMQQILELNNIGQIHTQIHNLLYDIFCKSASKWAHVRRQGGENHINDFMSTIEEISQNPVVYDYIMNIFIKSECFQTKTLLQQQIDECNRNIKLLQDNNAAYKEKIIKLLEDAKQDNCECVNTQRLNEISKDLV